MNNDKEMNKAVPDATAPSPEKNEDQLTEALKIQPEEITDEAMSNEERIHDALTERD